MKTYSVAMVLNKVSQFSSGADMRTFVDIFGRHQGEHLWRKFGNVYNFDFIAFWGSLDTASRVKLSDYLSS